MNEVTPFRVVTVVLTVLLGIAIGLGLRGLIYQPKPAHKAITKVVAAKASPTPTKLPTMKEPLYSLAIPAQRARDYPGSAITVESPLVDHGGWQSGVISYFSDGLKIYAQVATPTTEPPKTGYPTAIFVHGYVEPSAYATEGEFYNGFVGDIAKKGFMVVKPDLRGYGKSWGIPEGAYYSPGYTADVLNLATSLQHYPQANTSRLSVVGHSLGGRVVLNSIVVSPQTFRAGVIMAGAVGRLDDMYDNWVANSDFGDPVTLGIRKRVIELFGPPNTTSDFWQKSEPYNYLADVSTPILIVHSTNDDTVPYRFSESLKTALLAVGKTVQLTPYDGDHSFSGASHDAVVAELTAYLGEKLK